MPTRRHASPLIAATLVLLLLQVGSPTSSAVKVPPRLQCRDGFRDIFRNIDIDEVADNPGIQSCVASASEACCAEIANVVGMDTVMAGCTCYDDLFEEAFVLMKRGMSFGIDESIMNMARDVAIRRIDDCPDIPAPNTDECPMGLIGGESVPQPEPEPSSASETSNATDGANTESAENYRSDSSEALRKVLDDFEEDVQLGLVQDSSNP